ncbi:chondroadherin-like protein [Nerophis ophidion]|uniref:chondroadherin-like protein n=1 Tax=Nerophis ophidion TaxID=159077 RepID=UPI002AE0154D|nr:chondroadherin-like protein [Nerophis ophidion]
MLFLHVLLGTLVLTSGVQAGKCPAGCSCDHTKLSATCRGKNLTQVPPGLEESTVMLDLSNNNVQVLARGALVATPHLTHLTLQRCNMVQVKEGAFRTLGRLLSLNLAHNSIQVLHQESLDGLSSLKELHLDHNRLEDIQPGAFMQLGSVNMLALSHNQLVYIPNMLFQGLHNLKWLSLSRNSINNLAPEAFASLSALRRLSLDHNQLQFFPTQAMARAREVTRLDMSHNPMVYLGEESVSMPKLTHLYLDHMSLQDLSEQALSQAPMLSHLDLSHNQLRYLDPLSGPKNLASLNLTANPVYCSCYLRPLRTWATQAAVRLLGVCAGPPHLSDEPLTAVAAADMRCRSDGDRLEEEEEVMAGGGAPTPAAKTKGHVRCPLNCHCDVDWHHATCENGGHTRVPRGFPAKTQLLDLRGNHFRVLAANSFPGSSQVVSLHLDSCRIQEVEGGSLRGMKKLLYLYLSDNQLSSLPPDALAGAPQLSYLHLEGNHLAHFPGAAMRPLPGLFALHLERNAISKLEPSGMLSSVSPRLRELYLSNNTIRSVARGALDSAFLGKLHLAANKLTKVPSAALSRTPGLEELNLSHNHILSVGPNAFRPLSQSLKWLHMDRTNTEKMSMDALAGLGPGLKTLTLRGNRLKELPHLHRLTGLEVLDLQGNPLLCDCTLLPLRRWMDKVSMEVGATCGHPAHLKGQKVRDVELFKSCSPASGSASDTKGLVLPTQVKLKQAQVNLVKTKPGKNLVKTKPGKNLVKTKPGKNLVKTKPGKNLVNAKPGKNLVKTKPGKNLVKAKPGKNLVNARPGKNLVKTKPGKNLVNAKPGKNLVKSKPGKNLVKAKPGKNLVKQSKAK